jgi:hypothetical protein
MVWSKVYGQSGGAVKAVDAPSSKNPGAIVKKKF